MYNKGKFIIDHKYIINIDNSYKLSKRKYFYQKNADQPKNAVF